LSFRGQWRLVQANLPSQKERHAQLEEHVLEGQTLDRLPGETADAG